MCLRSISACKSDFSSKGAPLALGYAVGLNLWARGSVLDSRGNARIMLRAGSVVCFIACVAIVLFALWLMVPLFH